MLNRCSQKQRSLTGSQIRERGSQAFTASVSSSLRLTVPVQEAPGSQDHPAPPGSDAVEFCGPSSTEFTLNVAASNMRNAGPSLDVLSRTNLSRSSATHFSLYGPFMKRLTMDPLWDFHKHEAVALVEDWCFGLGDVYPIVARRVILDTVDNVFDSLELAGDDGLREEGGRVAEALFSHNTNKLKMILAISLTKETGGRDHRAERLFQSTSEAVKGLLWNPEGIHGVQLLYLTVSVLIIRLAILSSRPCTTTTSMRRSVPGAQLHSLPDCESRARN